MRPAGLDYVIVTAARDEIENLPRLARSIAAQSQLPGQWIVVDNGSKDGTREFLDNLCRRLPLLTVATAPAPPHRARGGAIAAALERGFEQIRGTPAVVFVMDADISIPDDHCESILREFERDNRLGIASGRRQELRHGTWTGGRLTGTSVEAQCRAYRLACLRELLPLERSMGWDGIDVALANVQGWRTRVLSELSFRHHRPVGGREGSVVRAWWREGEATNFMAYRPSYVLLRAVHNARAQPAALALIPGHLMARIRRRPRSRHRAARDFLRRQQRLRNLGARATEMRQGRCDREVDLLLVAESGGHLHELMSLEQAWTGFSRAWATLPGLQSDCLLAQGERVFECFGPTTRNVLNLARNLVVACRVLRRLRPRVVFATGAGVTVPFAWMAALLRVPVVYLECAGRISPSLSLRLVAPIATEIMVQWPETAAGRNRARFVGNMFLAP